MLTATGADAEPLPLGAVQVKLYVNAPVFVGVTDLEPLVGSAPDQSLSDGEARAEHEVAPLVDHMSVVDAPRVIAVGDAESETVGGGLATSPRQLIAKSTNPNRKAATSWWTRIPHLGPDWTRLRHGICPACDPYAAKAERPS